MTQFQCDTCCQPTKHCQDVRFEYPIGCSCLDYVPYFDVTIQALMWTNEYQKMEE